MHTAAQLCFARCVVTWWLKTGGQNHFPIRLRTLFHNGAPPLRHLFERSCVAQNRGQNRETASKPWTFFIRDHKEVWMSIFKSLLFIILSFLFVVKRSEAKPSEDEMNFSQTAIRAISCNALHQNSNR